MLCENPCPLTFRACKTIIQEWIFMYGNLAAIQRFALLGIVVESYNFVA
jgi:hypothetical protein